MRKNIFTKIAAVAAATVLAVTALPALVSDGRNCGMRILLLVYFGLYDRVEYMACGGVHRSDSSII